MCASVCVRVLYVCARVCPMLLHGGLHMYLCMRKSVCAPVCIHVFARLRLDVF